MGRLYLVSPIHIVLTRSLEVCSSPHNYLTWLHFNRRVRRMGILRAISDVFKRAFCEQSCALLSSINVRGLQF